VETSISSLAAILWLSTFFFMADLRGWMHLAYHYPELLSTEMGQVYSSHGKCSPPAIAALSALRMQKTENF
jgi:hypothetical protein